MFTCHVLAAMVSPFLWTHAMHENRTNTDLVSLLGLGHGVVTILERCGGGVHGSSPSARAHFARRAGASPRDGQGFRHSLPLICSPDHADVPVECVRRDHIRERDLPRGSLRRRVPVGRRKPTPGFLWGGPRYADDARDRHNAGVERVDIAHAGV